MKHTEPELATVVFLIKGNTIGLAKKKKNIHKDDGSVFTETAETWNGYGGKRDKDDASVRDTAVRELEEESGIIASPHNLVPVGNIHFFWTGNESEVADMDVYFFFLATWQGEPHETGEMGKPHFFETNKVPYQDMMPGDRIFLPKMIEGEVVVADIRFGQKHSHGVPLFLRRDEELII